MRWKLPLAVLLGLSFSDVASYAQRPPDDEGLPSASAGNDANRIEDAGYFGHDGVARFQLIQGRLCLDAPRHRKGAQHQETNGVFESITITAQRGIPSVHYIHRCERHEILLSVRDATAVRIESTLGVGKETAVIDQPADPTPGRHQIEWTVTISDRVIRHRGGTLLHLRSSDPERFDRHYGPLLRRLLRGRTIHSLSVQTDRALLARIERLDAIDLQTVNSAIDQLAAPNVATRRKAQRRLLSMGAPILPIIFSRSTIDLDAEQNARLQAIASALRPLDDDTPETLSALLLYDADHWSKIASRLTQDQVALANAHLSRIGSKPLSVTGVVHRVAQTEKVIR